MTKGAIAKRIYNGAATFSELLVIQAKKEEKQNISNYEHLWKFNISSVGARAIRSKVKQLHDVKLKNKGQVSVDHECNAKPFDTKLKIKQSFKDIPFMYNVTGQRQSSYTNGDNHLEQFIVRKNYCDKLCNGGQLLVRIR